MAGETMITVVGGLVDDPELRFTPSGVAVAKFRVAAVPRNFNKDTNQWEDAKDGLFLTCNAWRDVAENVAGSLQKGMRVLVQGRLKQRSWEDKEGQRRTVFELDVDDVGPSLKSATAKVEKAQRSSGSGGGGESSQPRGGWGGGGQGQSAGGVSQDDAWASSQGGQQGGGGWGAPAGGGYSEEPPF